ncbi:peptide-methionine (S)-S-oxide reductase MsrA [Halarcobacter anaerophilus]|uniref:Peptide methionine sulfoxide reductase MsrA n=1 Tax=Halarcobacter anaerophilus TaxID=877500 RepID=A0A4Q0XUC2_9BACT|nr:peptide-methionine (S)-S-oxide reductase MsrA [Halarcobacter anaerophilus]QDF28799.1 bifunctional (RS)-methionine sulfoxide reductase A/B [Halarcobacter anaerophilus]RXJ61130.1 peptide-methionine (S)-S-oxide reductase [Halarcobacter anaerophilus]
MIAEIVFAAGCFWGVEKHFENLNGVVDVKSGYVGGNYANPTYEKVLKYRKLPQNNNLNIINYTEGVLVKFDTSKTNADKLIKSFWQIHDPTQLNRQGNDVGNNYRSAIFYTNENQKNIAYSTKAKYQTLLEEHGFGKIVTQIKPLQKFYEAENYHQDYLEKNPNGYCPNHATGVKFEKKKQLTKDFITPLKGKEILVIKAEGFCPYCEKFEKEVSSNYKGTIPLRTVLEKQLKDFDIKTKLDVTPIILFIENGKEIFSHKGYLNEKEFYEQLGAFKLGENTESYNVAFNKNTDSRFCKQYDIFKNTPDGVFIDKVSGDILFDTKDRFNSKTGWLSFYKAVDGATIEKPDYSYGMNRVEVIAKKSGIHLGHVFDEFGHRRFCINATVLEFVPRDKIDNK